MKNHLLVSSPLGYTFLMKTRITKEEALAYKIRWKSVNEAEIQELRKATVPQKIQQLATLMASGKAFIVPMNALHEEETEIRKRWNRLREMYHASK